MSDVVWVTGSTGFTGQHQIAFLRQTRPSLRIVGVDVNEAVTVKRAQHRLDLNDSRSVMALAIAEPPTWVIHLAGLMPPSSESDMWRANVGGTVGLLVGLGAADCRQTRVVCVGSAAEYARTLRIRLPGGPLRRGISLWKQQVGAVAAPVFGSPPTRA